jgi:HEAT repeat protein
MITNAALVLGALVAAELVALVGRRAWVHWKLGRRAVLVDEAITALADALVSGVVPERPRGRTSRRAFRLAALELFPALAGESRRQLTAIAEQLGLVDDVVRTLRRSPRAYARRTATDELAEIGSASAVPALEAALGDTDRIVRIAAVHALAAVPELRRADRMTEILDRDSSASPSSAISAMLGLAARAPDLVAKLQSETSSPYARRLAALALANVGDRRATQALLTDAASENTLLASVAARALERVGGAP